MAEPALDYPPYTSTALRHPKEPLIKVGAERGGPALGDALVETWHWHVIVPAAPYVAVHVVARGLLRHLTTRICFDESSVPERLPVDRRDTLRPQKTDDGFRFDIRIQGTGETVFFDV